MTSETEVYCPYCGEPFSIVVDCSEDHQVYTEDCFICCRPIQFHIHCTDGELVSASGTREGG